MSIGFKGATNAAKTLTLAAVELFENRGLREAAATAHREALGEDFVYEALLGDLSDDLPVDAVDGQIRQNGGRGVVPVPDVVVDRLEVPDPLPSLRVQRDEAGREEVVPRPVTAVEVSRCGLGW